MPLSLRAWIEEVGSADLRGRHATLSFYEGDSAFPGIYADPLVITVPVELIAFEFKGLAPDERSQGFECILSTGPIGKARVTQDPATADESPDRYVVHLPSMAADCMLEGESHQTTFVDYLRIAFRWGGFPGWERYEKRPEQLLAYLREGLLPV